MCSVLTSLEVWPLPARLLSTARSGYPDSLAWPPIVQGLQGLQCQVQLPCQHTSDVESVCAHCHALGMPWLALYLYSYLPTFFMQSSVTNNTTFSPMYGLMSQTPPHAARSPRNSIPINSAAAGMLDVQLVSTQALPAHGQTGRRITGFTKHTFGDRRTPSC